MADSLTTPPAAATVPPPARSPLASYAEAFSDLGLASGGAIELTELPLVTGVDVRTDDSPAAADALAGLLGSGPPGPGHESTGVGLELLWTAPGEYLALAKQDGGPDGSRAAGRGPVLADRLEHALAGRGTACDVSAQRCVIRVSGKLAGEVLAHGCAIDLHPRSAPAGTCVQTLLAKAGVIICVDEAGRDFRVLVRSSFAGYLADWLLATCRQYRLN